MLIPALTALAVAGLLYGEANDILWLRIATKVPASLLFILYGWQNGALDGHADGVALFVALWLCAAGDWFLLSREKKPFMAGIGSFLLGHVGYLVVFGLIGISMPAFAAAALVVGLIAWRVWAWVGPHAGPLKPAVAAYVLVISTMVAAAIASVAVDPSPRRLTLLAGAVVFFISDLCVARDRFVSTGFENRAVGLPLYYAAQLMFAASAT
ncbi:MAG: lysoplasmalogenase [Proteobacteria bacterium]|nr:lysoplasmalogenase [Pseudomonadota bacterium]